MTEQEKVKLLKQAEEAHKAFQHWQEVRIAHLGYVVNLVLTLATASLGFVVKLAFDKPTLVSNCPFYCSLYVLAVSIGCGLLANVLRLCDFRYTAKAAKARKFKLEKEAGESLEPEDENEAKKHDCYRCRHKCFGRWTWRLLTSQLVIFAVGISLVMFGLHR